MMKWWRRLIFSIISLVLGYISLDYLYSAFTKLTNASGSAAAYSPKGDGLSQLLGAVMFLGYFVVLGFYIWMIKRQCWQRSRKIPWNVLRGGRKMLTLPIKKKWFDIILQIVIIITGMIIRWAYLMFIYLPKL